MSIKECFRSLAIPFLICWLLASSSANAQAPGNVAASREGSLLTKEKLFDGTGLSTEAQNRVMGNLLKHSRLGALKAGGLNEQGVFGAPGPIRPPTPMVYSPKAPGPIGKDSLWQIEDPCNGVVNDRQMRALHRLLVAVLAAKSVDANPFTANVPKDCNSEQLRYYLGVAAQLYPESGVK